MIKIFKLDRETRRMKLSLYLREKQNYSGRSLRTLKVLLDGKPIKMSKKLPSTGTLKVMQKEKETNIKPIKMDLDIVFEDDDLLIVNKPYGLLTHPTLKKVDKTLANGIVYHINTVPRFYNRLDMDTTGLIIVAKNAYAQSFLQKYGELKKKYLAIVSGKLDEDNIVIEEPIKRVEDKLERIIAKDGQYAKTVVRNLKYDKINDVSLVECELFTGRTHQIRVHLSHINHPIIGDKLYNKTCKYDKRQMLHAYKLSFLHPRTKQIVDISIRPYKDMEEWSFEYGK